MSRPIKANGRLTITEVMEEMWDSMGQHGTSSTTTWVLSSSPQDGYPDCWRQGHAEVHCHMDETHLPDFITERWEVPAVGPKGQQVPHQSQETGKQAQTHSHHLLCQGNHAHRHSALAPTSLPRCLWALSRPFSRPSRRKGRVWKALETSCFTWSLWPRRGLQGYWPPRAPTPLTWLQQTYSASLRSKTCWLGPTVRREGQDQVGMGRGHHPQGWLRQGLPQVDGISALREEVIEIRR